MPVMHGNLSGEVFQFDTTTLQEHRRQRTCAGCRMVPKTIYIWLTLRSSSSPSSAQESGTLLPALIFTSRPSSRGNCSSYCGGQAPIDRALQEVPALEPIPPTSETCSWREFKDTQEQQLTSTDAFLISDSLVSF